MRGTKDALRTTLQPGLERTRAQEGESFIQLEWKGVLMLQKDTEIKYGKTSPPACADLACHHFPLQDFQGFILWPRSSPPRGWSKPPPCRSKGSSEEQFNSSQGPRSSGAQQSTSPPKPASETARKPSANHTHAAPLLKSFCTFSPSTLAPSHRGHSWLAS